MTLSLFFSSISCFLLLLFSLHLFFAKRGNRLLNRLLALLFLSRFGQILITLFIHSDHQTLFPFVYQLFTPLWYITPACFYLYVISFIQRNQQPLKFQWLHFMPAIFAVIHIFPWHLSNPVNWNLIAIQIAENKQLFITERTGLFSPVFYYLGRPVLVIVYLSVTWYAVLKSKILDKKTEPVRRDWLLLFLRIGTFFYLAGFLSLAFWNIDKPYINTLFMIINGMIVLIIMVFVLHHPRLFYGYLFVSVNLNPGQKHGDTEAPAQINQAKKMSLLPEQLLKYSISMKEVMEIKQPYLLENFQIVDLAGELNIPVHHCSFVLNNLIGKNFRDWINEYRIRSFMEQYPLKSERMTIESVAHECGFKSTATFYNAFKKETGLMPTAYFSQKKVS
ncbi:helix-turn-helix domain-containing protein [Pedobacter caeni]|uniref:AraC-type DNA-binding protein n=1 Tax=Pedobacter caeni TaxID=288992 RepID=A0A1M4W3S8_9SPHI|nr:helix-turn-helix domain-containing protein [Pedobacter caeni]SHE75954.1 AraC-type DNA-binding protein [Pedobacter caeni]